MKKKKEFVAITLILLAFSSGMILTAATSGCDTHNQKERSSQTSALHPSQPDQRSAAEAD